MTRLDWLACWDELRERVSKGNTTWGRNQIIDEMNKIEMRRIRELEEDRGEIMKIFLKEGLNHD